MSQREKTAWKCFSEHEIIGVDMPYSLRTWRQCTEIFTIIFKWCVGYFLNLHDHLLAAIGAWEKTMFCKVMDIIWLCFYH